VAYRVVPGARARAQLGGLPRRAFDALIDTLADVATNPYDPLRTFPAEQAQERWAIFGQVGFVQFSIDDGAEVVTVVDVTWAG
jgi:hypothetical protein